MEKKAYGPNLWFYPLPLVVVGAIVKGKPTFTTIAWSTPIEDEPPLILVTLAKEHYILAERESLQSFSLNFPSMEMVEKVDFCGIVSGYEHDKSHVFALEWGKLHTPLIEEAPLSLECRVHQWLDLEASCWLLVGEVVESYVREDCFVNGKPDVEKMKTMAYITKQSEYRALGEVVAKAREIGLQHLKKEK